MRAHECLRSFPTRRSSDLVVRRLCEHAAIHVDRGGVVAELDGGELRGAHAHVAARALIERQPRRLDEDRKSTRRNSSHVSISYAVFRLKKKTIRTGFDIAP